MTNAPDDAAVPAEGWPTMPASEQPVPQPVKPDGDADAELEVTEPNDPHAQDIAGDAEAQSNYRPEGWVEGEQMPGADPIPDENVGDDAGVDHEGNEPEQTPPAES